ncbi:hypothetical protein [Olleya namhaensis]|uniref:hypothetical protein n=1 Tax=Olleya namhaensis TaxID=1144750 RepID=UPI00249362B1|nr:hypothetical protein [Olleya namhaensis]
MKKLAILIFLSIFSISEAQESFSIPTINSFNYKEINKSGESKLYVFLSFNECETCYKITDDRLLINNNAQSDLNQSINLDIISTETSKVFTINKSLLNKNMNFTYTYKVNGIEKKFNFPIYDKTPKIDDNTQLNVQLKDAKKYDDEYLEFKIIITNQYKNTIQGIEINDLGLLYDEFKIIKENFNSKDSETEYVIRVNNKNVVNKLLTVNDVKVKIKPFGFVLTKFSNLSNLDKGNSLSLGKIQLKNAQTLNEDFIDFEGDIFQVNNRDNFIKISTKNNISNSFPKLELIDIKNNSLESKFIYNKVKVSDQEFIYSFKLGECCIGSGTYKLLISLQGDHVIRKEEIIIKKEVKNYVSKLTYDNRFDQIILTINTINAIDDGVDPKISLNDPNFNSTFGIDNDIKSLTEFRFKPILFNDPRLIESTSNIIYFDIDKDEEVDFSFKFYFVSQEKIKEAVKKALEYTNLNLKNKSNSKKIKILNEIKSSDSEMSVFAENLKKYLKEYLGSDDNAAPILNEMSIDLAQAEDVLNSVIIELDGAVQKTGFLNTGFGKVITSVVAVLPKVLPIILAL